MRPCDLARLLGTTTQNVHYMKITGKVKTKKDKYGFTLVKGI